MNQKTPRKGYKNLTVEKARIIAHLIGDGAHYKTKHDYVMKYEVKDQESLDMFYRDIISAYGLEPSLGENVSGITGKKIKFIRLRSKIVFEDLLRYATYKSADWNIKSNIMHSSKKIKKEFLKALYDDEGSIRKEGITLYSINESGLMQIQKLLLEFSIFSRVRGRFGQKRNVFGLITSDKIKFYEEIGFNLKRKKMSEQK